MGDCPKCKVGNLEAGECPRCNGMGYLFDADEPSGQAPCERCGGEGGVVVCDNCGHQLGA